MKFGIAGSGAIVQEVLPLMPYLPIQDLSICGRAQSKDKLSRLAKAHAIQTVYTDYQEFLNSNVETVYIGVSNDIHFDYARQALLAGKNVLVEKPLAEDERKLDELFQIADSQSTFLLEAMNIHALPAFQSLKSDLSKIGQPRMVILNYSQYSSRYDKFREGQTAPVFDPKRSGGAMMDLNVYNLQAAISLFGTPKSAAYHANIQKGIDTSGVLHMTYEGFQVLCIGAKDCHSPSTSVIEGEDGCMTLLEPINQLQSYVLMEGRRSQTISRPYERHRLYAAFRALLNIIETRDIAQARQLQSYTREAVRIMEQTRQSAGVVFG